MSKKIPAEKMYLKGMRVWIPHPNKVWESAIILEDYDTNQNKLYIRTDESRETRVLDVNSSAELPTLHLTENSSIDFKSNLSSLTVIHEATILHLLRSRFEESHIYSYCGVSTIVLNPYSRLPKNEIDDIWNYQKSNLRRLHPHIFGVAENVYIKLERENRDQTIVFTGESGAGKSFNAERAISYLTTTSSKDDQVRAKILASSVILQAFGHASTAFNNNSSRFGKFIQMQYDKNYHVIGALLTTCNLDRSKIGSHGLPGTIFNIFYHVYAARESLPHLQLNECQFKYLETKTNIEACNVRNRKLFEKTVEAFNVLGFSDKEQNEIWKILAVTLHLQSLAFKKIEGREINTNIESCTIADPSHLKRLGKVLSLDEKALLIMRKWMCYKRTFCVQDEILQPMNLDEATRARDALAKLLYTKLFNWLVTRANASFRSPCHVQSFIGILDMHGFETLDSNSFEQFCINYIDEKVEQLFVQSLFKVEQEEYAREEIGWTYVSFSNNMPCVELIDGKFGILDLLEEETKMSSNNNLPWLENLHLKFDNMQNFEKPTGSIANFTIHHFAQSVQYDATDFLSKNCESVIKEQLEVLRETKNELLSKFIVEELLKPTISKIKRRSSLNRRSSFSSKPSKKMVSYELRTSLAVLSAILRKTKLSFVRCIKSNDEEKPLTFDSQCVVKQLRAFNVCETIKISTASYFQQSCYKEFFRRYHCLCNFEDMKHDDKREVCQKILIVCRVSEDVKFGKTKVFLREDTIDYLENLRATKRREAATTIQKSMRRFLQQKRYNEIRRLVHGIQRFARGYLVRHRMQAISDKIILENLSATKIQACFRGYLQHRWFQYVKHKLPVPRAYANQVVHSLGRFYSEDVAATEIQRHVKSFLARRRYEDTLKKIIIVQSFVRRFLAMMELKKLKHQNVLRTEVLNKSIEKNLDFLQERINCLASMNLSPEDLESVHSIADDQTCVQTKNRILNEILFRKIKSLQDLRANQKPCDIPSIKCSQPEPDNSVDKNLDANCQVVDKPMNEKYNNKELYQKLFDSFQQVDRDAKTLQQTAASDDVEISTMLESYRNSFKTHKTLEIIVSDADEKVHSEVHSKDAEVPQEQNIHRTSESARSTSPLLQNLTIDTKDLQELNPYTFTQPDMRPIEESFESEEEYQERFMKKASRLTILYNDDEESSEETPTAELPPQNSSRKLPTVVINNSELAVSSLNSDKKLERKLKAEKKFRMVMFGDDGDSIEEAYDVTYDGMFEFDLKTTASVIEHLTDVSPTNFIEYDLSTDFPAQILIMCIRYADYKNDFLAALSLLHNYIKKVRYIVETHELLHVNLFWLSNTHKLLNYLKQFSKQDERSYQFDEFHAHNKARQNQQRLRNINLRDTWVTLEQTCKYIANSIIKEMKSSNIALYSVRALLYAESIYETPLKKNDNEPTVDILLNELTTNYDVLVKYSIDRQIILQIFKPLFNYINSVTLSHVLSHSNLCSVSRSIQIRYSLRSLERWVLDRRLAPLLPLLNPIIQAVQFLQIQPISQNDVMFIHKKYDQISCNQMLKIIELYNNYCSSEMPASYDRVSVSPGVINKLKQKIKIHGNLDDTLILDPEEYPIECPFRHSKIKLEEVEIPQLMYLPMLKKI